MASAPITTSSQLTAPVNAVFQQTLLRNAKMRTPYFVGTMPAEIQEHRGSYTAKWRRIENLSAATTALSELTGNVAFPTRVSVQPSVTDFTVAVQKYGNFILLNEEVDLLNFNEYADKLVEILGINAGQSLNRLQRDVGEGNATILYPAGATNDGTTGSVVTIGQMRKAVNNLGRNSGMRFTGLTRGEDSYGTAPVPAAFWGICHVDVEEDIRAMSDFLPVERYAGQTDIMVGEFGMNTAARIRWISTEEASVGAGLGATSTTLRNTTSSADLYTSLVFAMEAMGTVGLDFEHIKEVYMAGDSLPGVQVIMKERGSAGVADPLNELSSLGWKSWHAGKILNTGWIYGLRSGATLLQ